MKQLWTESHRPKGVDGYVFKDSKQKKQISQWISQGALPHMLLSGAPGTGKSTLIKVLLHELKVDPFDVLEVNASKDNGVDFIRETITRFSETMGYGNMRYVFLDEADGLSPTAQGVLRGTMEKYASSVRFLLTCVTGETKVYTPFGWKYIKDVKDNDNILSSNKFLTNKALVKKQSSDVYCLKTKHGYSINATGNHRFATLLGEKTVNELKVGDSIPVHLLQLHGNDYEYCNSSTFFDINDYRQFLQDKSILSDYQVTFLNNNKHLWFTGCKKQCYDYLVQSGLTKIHVATLKAATGLSTPAIRSFIKSINNYIVSSKHVRQNYFEYTIDLISLIKDVDNFRNLAKQHVSNIDNISQLHLRNINTQENYISALPTFTDEVILSLGRIVGFMEGDGHLSTTVHCAANNKNTLEKLHADIIKIVPGLKFNISKNGNNSKGLCSYYNNVFLKNILEYFGATTGNKSVATRVLPKHSSNKLFFKGFMQALYDSDGKSFSIKNDLSVTPVHLTQNIYSTAQRSFFDELSEKLKMHFNIHSQVSVHNTSASTFGGSDLCMSLMCCDNANILRYHQSIGHYYDKTVDESIVGYLLYKSTQAVYNFLKFSEWKSKYYGFGLLNDEIVELKKLDGEHTVYDCSFEHVHWYITAGFLSHNCNYPHKIIPAIKSRCETGRMHIEKLDNSEFLMRLVDVLDKENIEIDPDALESIVKASYPDLRRGISMIQANSFGGKLTPPNDDTEVVSDYKLDMIALFRAKKYTEARKLICSQVQQDEYEDIYKFMYQNIDVWADGDINKEDQSIIVIRDGLVKDTQCADREINLSATFCELEMVAKGTY